MEYVDYKKYFDGNAVTVHYADFVPSRGMIIQKQERRVYINPGDRWNFITNVMGWEKALEELRKEIHHRIHMHAAGWPNVEKTFPF